MGSSTKKTFFLALVLFSFALKASQPEIFNYTTDDYPGHSINFSIIEDANGIMYIANAYSALEFDGINWRSISFNDVSPNCFAKDSFGRIYVGTYSDFGYLKKDDLGNSRFVSLKPLIKGTHKKVGIVNYTQYFKGNIYFASNDCIYKYDGKKIEVIEPEIMPDGKRSVFGFLGITNNELLCYNSYKGLGIIFGNKYHPLPNFTTNPINWCYGVFSNNKDKYLLIEEDKISVIYKNDYSSHPYSLNGTPLKVRSSHAIAIDAKTIAVATETHGILICDLEGKILNIYDKKSGLKSNYVNYLYLDSRGFLWAALNNGIAVVKLSSAFEYINENNRLEGMGYSSLLHNDTLFLGTSQGLFFAPQWLQNKNVEFKKVEGVGSVVHHIKLIRGKIVCSDQAEVYELNGVNSKKISQNEWYSGWTFKKIPGIDTLMIVGTYADLSVYVFKKGHWIFKNVIQNFTESARMFEFDENGVIWLVQGLSGLFRIEVDKTFSKATSVENYCNRYHVTPGYFNDIVKVGDQLKIASDGGIYYLKHDSLIKDPSFSNLNIPLNRLRSIENTEGELYVIQNERPVFLELRKGKYCIANASSTLKDKLVGSAEFVAKITQHTYIIATQQGFALYSPEKVKFKNELLTKCLIRKITLINTAKDSVLSMGLPLSMSLPYTHNNLGFYFSLPIYGAYNSVLYHTELRSKNEKLVWTDESPSSFKEYTNLPEGKYSFTVWAKINGNTSKAAQTSFVILAPWYRSLWAYLFYFFLLVATILFAIYFVRLRFDKQRKKMEQEKQNELLNKEALHKNELLEIELQRKNDEMAFVALNYTQKKQSLSVLKNNLSQLLKTTNDPKNANELKTLIRSIGVEDKETESWEKFQMHFDNTNDNFFQKLKQIDPKITESTLLMCSYIRMGKSNKDIAELLNISISGVEKRKYRLKEKLNVNENKSITDFIVEL